MWNAGCGFWDKGILTKAAYAKFNENMRDEFDIEGRDVKWTTANHGYSVTEEIYLLHVQERLETLMYSREGVLKNRLANRVRFSHISVINITKSGVLINL